MNKYFSSIIILSIFFTYSCKQSAPEEVNDQIIAIEDYDFSSNATIPTLELNKGITEIYKSYSDAKVLRYEGKLKNMIAVSDGLHYGMIDIAKNIIVPIQYNNIFYTTKAIVFQKDNSYLFYNENLEKQGEILSTDLSKISNHYFIVKNTMDSQNNYQICNEIGERINEINYKAVIMPKSEKYYLGLNEEWVAYTLKGEAVSKTNQSALLAADLLNNEKVNIYGYGPFKVGMSRKSFIRKIDIALEADYLGENCQTYTLGDDFLNISFLFEEIDNKSILCRIYFNEKHITTRSKIGINSPIKTMLKTYSGKIETKQNKYRDRAKDYFFVPRDQKDKKYRVNFLGEDDIIKSFSIGLVPQIFYVEGCL